MRCLDAFEESLGGVDEVIDSCKATLTPIDRESLVLNDQSSQLSFLR
jgi:hypothetical protein